MAKRISTRNSVSAERIREVFDYDPLTGLFTALVSRSSREAGTVTSGSVSGEYLELVIDWVRIKAHIVAWIWMTGEWPKAQVDHRDLDKRNNRWENLREATKPQNSANTPLRSNNTSGSKGVSWDKYRGKWMVRIKVDGKYLGVGRFDVKEDAI